MITKRVGLIFFYWLVVQILVGCTSVNLPVPKSSAGEWQRPLDLKLLSHADDLPGSLFGLKIKVECGLWDASGQTFVIGRDAFCDRLAQSFIGYGAKVDADDYQLGVRFSQGKKSSRGCGLVGVLTYLSLGFISCKTKEWNDGHLQLLDSYGKVLAHYPLQFRRIQYFGWPALYLGQTGRVFNELYEGRLEKYTVNRVYTLAVLQKLIRDPYD